MITLTESMLLQIYPRCNRPRLQKIVPLLNQYMSSFHLNETKLRVAHFLAQTLHESGGFNIMEEKWNYSRDRLLQVFPKYFNANNVSKYAHSPKVFDRTYAYRMWNGNEASGDGSKYRGRGILQLTGRESYTKFTTWYQSCFTSDATFRVVDLLKIFDENLQNTFLSDEIKEIQYWYMENYPFERENVDFVKYPELIGSNMKYAVISGLWEFCIDKHLNKIADDDNIKLITLRINGGYNGYAERKLILNKAKKILDVA